MIDCPSCSNEVPQGAPRCKHCFSDLTEHWDGPVSRGNPLLPVILLSLLLAGVSFWVWDHVSNQQQLGAMVIDKDGERVVLVYTSTFSEPTTNQIAFSEIKEIELHAARKTLQGVGSEVLLVTTLAPPDDRIMVDESNDAILMNSAKNLAKKIGNEKDGDKPIVETGDKGPGGELEKAL